ncbi:MAG: hypothetical protein EOP04_02465, partial [Proteobacteria bacterium]
MAFTRYVAILVCCAQFACQTNKYYEIDENHLPQAELSEMVSKDIVNAVKANFHPSKQRVLFPHHNERVALMVESKLRKAGFAFYRELDDFESGDLRIGYKLDSIDKQIIILRFVVNDSFQINRLYRLERDGTYT